jgi:hypothetical protein
MVILKIPGFCIWSNLIHGRVDPGYDVLLQKGASMVRRWDQDEILYKISIALIEYYTSNVSIE